MPALDERNSRRLTPSRRDVARAVSSISAATRSCSGVGASGRYSSFETTGVGIGENPFASASLLHFRIQRALIARPPDAPLLSALLEASISRVLDDVDVNRTSAGEMRTRGR